MAGTLATIAGALAGAGVFLVTWMVTAWLLCAVLVALAAHGRGRSGPLWLGLCILLTPWLAALMLLVFSDRSEVRIREHARNRRAGLRLCPSCSEVVRDQAGRCRFCLVDLNRRAEAVAPSIPDERVEPRLR